jgi:hypothetical protein
MADDGEAEPMQEDGKPERSLEKEKRGSSEKQKDRERSRDRGTKERSARHRSRSKEHRCGWWYDVCVWHVLCVASVGLSAYCCEGSSWRSFSCVSGLGSAQLGFTGRPITHTCSPRMYAWGMQAASQQPQPQC